MISTSNNNLYTGLLLLALVLFFFIPVAVHAAQTLTISPTLFDAKVIPGQTWSSTVRVVNPNEYPITVYVESVNFFADDETGRPSFIPIITSETNGSTLAEWVRLPSAGIVVPNGQSITVPFSVEVPVEAPPGGHYAAITIGTKPPTLALTDTSQVTTAQVVSALLFMKVDGNIIEQASIREFRAENRLAQTSENNFSLRVQNSGNVHVQPQGEITIYNMWGAKRGTIPINQQTQYGAVLKESVREFNFSWSSEGHPFDIGRYQAVVALGYGDEQKQFIQSTTYFWVFPYTIVLVTIAVIFGFAYFVSVMIRLYIRRVLLLSGIDPQEFRRRPVVAHPRTQVGDLVLQNRSTSGPAAEPVSETQPQNLPLKALIAPGRLFLQDIMNVWYHVRQHETVKNTLGHFCFTYRYLFLFIFITVLMIIAIWWFRSVVQSPMPYYEVTMNTGEDTVTVSSEQLFYDTLPAYSVSTAYEFPEQLSTITLVNTSGTVGTAARLQRVFDGHGVIVGTLTADSARVDKRTIIVYDRAVIDEAIAYSKFLDNALLSVRSDTATDSSEITIYVGQDYLATE